MPHGATRIHYAGGKFLLGRDTASGGTDLGTLAADSCWRLERMARKLRISTRALQIMFRRDLEIAPKAWLAHQRAVAARAALGCFRSTKRAANHLGFASASHFCHEFRRAHGITPGHFLRLASGLTRGG